MASRWEERLARASGRVSEQTPSGVQTLARRSDVSRETPTSDPPPALPESAITVKARPSRVAPQATQAGTAAPSGETQAPATLEPAGPAWLRNPQRALLRVALVSCTILLGLLYFGGFLG